MNDSTLALETPLARSDRDPPRRIPTAWTRMAALTRLEIADALRSRWALFTAASYGLVFGGFVWLGLRESSVLGFTGLSRVVLNVSNAVVVAVPLVALVATCQAVVRARTTGHLEIILTQPCRRSEWFAALAVSRLLVLAGPLLAMLALAVPLGWWLDPTDRALLPLVLRAAALAGGLVVCFAGVGLWISAVSRTVERAMVLGLLAWLATAALHDFALLGVLLQWRLPPNAVFALAALNPIEAARIAVLATIDPDLTVLGPVGFWVASALGPAMTFAVGTLWPLTAGLAALAMAWRRLLRADAVA